MTAAVVSECESLCDVLSRIKLTESEQERLDMSRRRYIDGVITPCVVAALTKCHKSLSGMLRYNGTSTLSCPVRLTCLSPSVYTPTHTHTHNLCLREIERRAQAAGHQF